MRQAIIAGTGQGQQLAAGKRQPIDRWNILPGQGRYNDPVLYDRDGHRIYRGYVTEVITDLATGGASVFNSRRTTATIAGRGRSTAPSV